jgi:hypothetical protein
MSWGQKLGIFLIVMAFVGAKIFLIFSKPTGIGVAILGAVLTIVSESTSANAQEPYTP